MGRKKLNRETETHQISGEEMIDTEEKKMGIYCIQTFNYTNKNKQIGSTKYFEGVIYKHKDFDSNDLDELMEKGFVKEIDLKDYEIYLKEIKDINKEINSLEEKLSTLKAIKNNKQYIK